jgi:hypothetical protein
LDGDGLAAADVMTWRQQLRVWSAFVVARTGRASVVCLCLHHAEACFEVTHEGPSWVCPDCRRSHVSSVFASEAARALRWQRQRPIG